MHIQVHPLSIPASGTQRQLQSLHYGRKTQGLKVYLQASLHADEIPGMLVLHHLRKRLDAAEAQQAILGEIVLVPLANPIGLDQMALYHHHGRFELGSMENFNRHYPDFFTLLKDQIAPHLGADPESNQRAIRTAMQAEIAQLPRQNELQSLRATLMTLAYDADVALDLHCDFEANLHAYIETPYIAQAEALMRHLRVATVLHTRGFGGNCFDEALSGPWWRLQEHFPQHPIPLACLSTTLELRGQNDVRHDYAVQDAAHIYAYLQHLGVIAHDGTSKSDSAAQPNLPDWPYTPLPLAGTARMDAPHPGLITFLHHAGDHVTAGTAIAEVIEPLSGRVSPITAPCDGTFYAHYNARWATAGQEIGRIAGTEIRADSQLLSP